MPCSTTTNFKRGRRRKRVNGFSFGKTRPSVADATVSAWCEDGLKMLLLPVQSDVSPTLKNPRSRSKASYALHSVCRQLPFFFFNYRSPGWGRAHDWHVVCENGFVKSRRKRDAVSWLMSSDSVGQPTQFLGLFCLMYALRHLGISQVLLVPLVLEYEKL